MHREDGKVFESVSACPAGWSQGVHAGLCCREEERQRERWKHKEVRACVRAIRMFAWPLHLCSSGLRERHERMAQKEARKKGRREAVLPLCLHARAGRATRGHSVPVPTRRKKKMTLLDFIVEVENRIGRR